MNKKTPKGTIDLFGDSFRKMADYKNTLEEIFISYGGVGLDTPVFEIRDNLLGKYGEEAENKLVFNLEDCKTEKGEKYTLRYDLTVPKMRFIAAKNILSKRIYSIGKVYRRDNPSIGRYREFYQADFDIVGESSDSLVNEFMLLKMATEFLRQYGCEDFTIFINDTRYLNYLLVESLGIDRSLFKSVCSSVDKLDKCEYKEIVPELLSKGLTEEQVEKLQTWLSMNEPILPETSTKIQKLIEYANKFDFGNKIVFSPALARGLDYYNGMIYEIKLSSSSSSSSPSSTIISGGRYDTPSKSLVGISFGLTRIADLYEKKEELEKEKWKENYYLTSLNEMSFLTKLEYIKKCEDKFGVKIMINSEETDKKLIKTINYCIANQIRYIILLGDEIKDGKIILKDLKENIQSVTDL